MIMRKSIVFIFMMLFVCSVYAVPVRDFECPTESDFSEIITNGGDCSSLMDIQCTEDESIIKERRGWEGGLFDRNFWSELWHRMMHGHGRIRIRRVSSNNCSPVPEPTTFFLLGTGLVSLIFMRKKKGIYSKK